MAILIIHSDLQGNAAAVLAWLGGWLTARGIGYRVLAADAPQLAAAVVTASAIVSVTAHADSGAQALARGFRSLPEGGLAGKAFLWIGAARPSAADHADLGQLWLALEKQGVEIQIKPVLFRDWADGDTALSGNDISRLEDGLVALAEGITFCKRLQKTRESLALAQCFAHAPILA